MKTPGVSLVSISLALSAFAATACTGKTTREAGATILALRGSVLVESGDPAAAQETEAGDTLARGQTLRTTAGATAFVLLLPGTLAHLGPESSLQVDKIALTKNGHATDEAMERALDLRLLNGTLDVVVQFDSAPGTWQIVTPQGTLTATRPGTCRMDVRATSVRVTCVRGAFGFLPPEGGPTIDLTAGSYQEFSATPSTAAPVELDAHAQAAVEQTLEAERALLDLQRRARFSPFPWRSL